MMYRNDRPQIIKRPRSGHFAKFSHFLSMKGTFKILNHIITCSYKVLILFDLEVSNVAR